MAATPSWSPCRSRVAGIVRGLTPPARLAERLFKNLAKNTQRGLASANWYVYNCLITWRRSARACRGAGGWIFSNSVVVN
jgi:hypothetical protein